MPETEPHPIRLRNTLTRRVERLVPLDWREGSGVPEADRRVRMYVCGPTVYDRAHLGNARSAVVYDVLFRLLRHVYGAERVIYVRNLTDIDDKIIARARETGRPVEEITEETIRWYHEDMDALGCLRPTHEPRATEYLAQMIAMIEALIARGHAYEAEGHVLFGVASYDAYGRLSGRSVEDMIAGARVDVAPYKRGPMDFVLWKPSGEGVPGWPSPWGRGRPGWHIECSAMARDLLGGAFDIHGGGLDLQFPHHENELAQSRCAHPDEGFAQVWMHNEMLMVDGRKMSKSLGNFTTVRDLLDRHVSGDVIRLALLMSHYGKPADWTTDRVEECHGHLANWHRFKDRLERCTETDPETVADPDGGLVARLADDLNTPAAFSRLVRLGTDAQLTKDDDAPIHAFFASVRLLGLKIEDPDGPARCAGIAGSVERADVDVTVRHLLDDRARARRERDFARADEIRDALARAGILIADTAEGARWEIGPSFDPAKLEEIA